MCRSRLWLLYWVSTQIRRQPALTRLESAKSISRYRPPNGTAGLARSAVSGASRLPAPPASTIPRTRGRVTSDPLQHRGDDLLSLLLDAGQLAGSAERLGVQLVNVLGARRPGREPAGGGDDLEPAERLAVARRGGLPGQHRLPGQLVHADLVGREPGQGRLLLPAGRGVDPGVGGVAELGGERAVVPAGRAVGDRGDLGREQGQDDAVLVGRPHPPVAAQERRTGALLAAEGDAAVEQAGHEPLEPDRHLDQAA